MRASDRATVVAIGFYIVSIGFIGASYLWSPLVFLALVFTCVGGGLALAGIVLGSYGEAYDR